MKRFFWGGMYLLAAFLAALTFYLYVIPEGEIALAEGGHSAAAAEDMPAVPIITVGGVQVEVGSTKVQKLLDGGFQLKFEADGELYDLNPEESSAEAKMQYSVFLYSGEQRVAAVRYTNAGAEALLPGECTVDALEFETKGNGFGAVPVLLDDVDMAGLTVDQIPVRLSEFTAGNAAVPEYRRGVITAERSIVAYIRGSQANSFTVTEFGVRNYTPGAVGEDAERREEETADNGGK